MQISLLFVFFLRNELRKARIKQKTEKHYPPMVKDNSKNRKANQRYNTDCCGHDAQFDIMIRKYQFSSSGAVLINTTSQLR